MDGKDARGNFSRELFSLKIQVDTLLEGAGGEQAASLLDALSEINASEQQVAIGIFRKALKRLQEGEVRLSRLSDEMLQEFEDTLYEDLVDSLRKAVNEESGAGERDRRFSVVDGGRKPPTRRKKEKLIDFQSAYEAKHESDKNFH